MAKYMLIGGYTSDGAKGLLKDGGTARVEAARAAIASAGGTIESFYFGFGTDDFYVTIDLPDHVAASAAALAIASSGKTTARTVVLITPEEIDRAAQVSVDYRPPGG
jgi:uncharacterized protein with GYD domain